MCLEKGIFQFVCMPRVEDVCQLTGLKTISFVMKTEINSGIQTDSQLHTIG